MIAAALAGALALGLATTQELKIGAPTDSHPKGFLAEPANEKPRGVLVLHPWWGLNADVKAFCTRLAASGYVAFAPDLFGGRVVDTPDAAMALVKEHDAKAPELQKQIQEAADFLAKKAGKPEIAVVGFSFGAYYALEFSNAAPDRVRAVVVFYGTGAEDFKASKAAYLGHFAENDEFEPKESVEALAKLLRDAGRPATIHTYPGTGHWFFEPSVKSAFNQQAAALAWDRTLAFLKETLPGER